MAGGISIHAPREGGDHRGGVVRVEIRISIHAPREGGDSAVRLFNKDHTVFQSTPPARGATIRQRRAVLAARISIHDPREGGDGRPAARKTSLIEFQSTPPARGATLTCSRFSKQQIFQSTPPARGATRESDRLCRQTHISIHAPREGGDDVAPLDVHHAEVFQSTPPARGATRKGRRSGELSQLPFQSTPPARGATHTGRRIEREPAYFNPRPPRGGRRCRICAGMQKIDNFNPRPPRGGRRRPRACCRSCSLFQSTPPARGATALINGVRSEVIISIHAPREGGDCSRIA